MNFVYFGRLRTEGKRHRSQPTVNQIQLSYVGRSLNGVLCKADNNVTTYVEVFVCHVLCSAMTVVT